MSQVRVRFAPSPTGELHVGGLRTALFNFLYAKKHGGTFILRIEDTDRSRYVHEAEIRLLEMLQWSGIVPDEGPGIGGDFGPYHQSERLELYQEVAEKLIEMGHAYPCFCSTETLDEMRKLQTAKGLPTRYDGRCQNLSDSDRETLLGRGVKPVVRMKIPIKDERIVVRDLVRGNVAFNTTQLDDQVLMKSDGFPTYHLAVVVDDNAMGITHVLRAEEWLPSTPKHLLLYRWLGFTPPQYAHLPLLLNEDRSKMSKRKGDVTVEAFKAKGYLPQALVNFIALLGWNAGDDQELFTLQELIDQFSIERIGKTGAVFNREKLDWMNQIYLQALSPEELVQAVSPFFSGTPFEKSDKRFLCQIAAVVQPALTTLADFPKHLPLFFKEVAAPLEPEEEAKIKTVESRKAFAALQQKLSGGGEWNAEKFMACMKEVQKETGVKGKLLWEPTRLALTRDTQGPELPMVVEILGREKILARLKLALTD
ncbi:MAG: glutamate--tRNA ligase [Deltaproteobacteria bacterium]|nr:glutamate--tRNA ligase [Deltaproteobacteria bacterium]